MIYAWSMLIIVQLNWTVIYKIVHFSVRIIGIILC